MSILESFFCEYSNVFEIDEQCPVCLEQLYNIDILDKCKHRVHLNCIEKFAMCNSLSYAECPLCRCPTPEANYIPDFDTSNIVKYEVISNTQVRAEDSNGIVAFLNYRDDDQDSLSDDSLYFSDHESDSDHDLPSDLQSAPVTWNPDMLLKLLDEDNDLQAMLHTSHIETSSKYTPGLPM